MGIKGTFVWTSVHTLIKILAGIVMNKVVAVYLGPAGLALLGQFQNFSQLVVNVATGSIHSGIVKYTAEHKESKEMLNKVWNNALMISVFLSVIAFAVVLVFSSYFAHNVLFSYSYTWVMIVFSCSIFLYVLNMYVLAVINGLQNIGLFTYINILISILTLVSVSFLTIRYQMMGALYALIATQSLVFIVSFFLMYRKYKLAFFSLKTMRSNYDVGIVKNLLAYGAVSFVSGVSMMLMLMAVRAIIQQETSLEYAGYWESLWKISVYFTMLGILPASIYYLPKFSELSSVQDIKQHLRESILFFIPLLMVVAVLLYYLRSEVILLLFTKDFLVISSTIGLMLFGDIIRVAAYLVVNIMYAKSFTRRIIIMDLVYNSLFVLLVYMTFHEHGLDGIGYSYIVVNMLVLFYVLVFYFTMPRLLAVGGRS